MTRSTASGPVAAGTPDGRVERGNLTRRLVLARTMEIASEEGLDALALGRLAIELNLSKSGIFALFGSKEELQLATVRAASRVFVDHVVEPTLAAPPGLQRIRDLCARWTAYSRDRVFPGGCFFERVGAEYASRPGPVHDAIREVHRRWSAYLGESITDALHAGEIGPDEDPAQIAFELRAALGTANAESLLTGSLTPYAHAQEAIRRRLDAAGTPHRPAGP